jgi:transcriptional regulator GlxA family with amidase domain
MNGPLDAFIHANQFNGSRYNVYTVAATAGVVLSENQIVTILPQYSITDCPDPDIVVIPGTMSKRPTDPTLVAWIRQKGLNPEKIVMSVCIGAMILAQTGLLNGRNATTHYQYINTLHTDYPEINIVKNVRFVQDGNIVTTGGVTSGIDGGLHLVENFDGPTIAQQTSDLMVYNRNSILPPYTILPPYY